MLGPVVCDIAGTELLAHEKDRIAHPLVGMVILFTRNFTSREQLTQLCTAIHAVKPGVLIAVDHEGGRVQRFREGFTRIPCMQRFGEIYKTDPQWAEQALTSTAYVMAAELRACGVDLTFAPVLDMDYGQSVVIGDRAFAKNSQVVTSLARCAIAGLRMAGMSNCGKHFPGHGWVNVDSHEDLPHDERSEEEILNADAKPYSWLGIELNSVMTAHIVFDGIDAQPATFSSKLLNQVLRQKLGFAGFVFSDDLHMKGAHVVGDMTERVQAALEAGCDGVICCNAPEETDEMLQKVQFVPSAGWQERANLLNPAPWTLSWDELQNSSIYQKALSDVIAVSLT